MKKAMLSLVLSFFVGLGMPIQKSEAVVGLMTANPVLTIFGAAYLGLPAADLFLGSKARDVHYLLLGMGMIMLDSPTTPMTFSSLADGSETKLKISNEDRMTFNSELDEAQAIGQSLAQDLVKTYGSQSNVDYKKVAQVADQKWNQICEQGQLSAGTCRAIFAIRSQELKK